MNRRQKMKRMKQELEWYKKQMVPMREVERPEIKTLVNVSYYHMHDYKGRVDAVRREVGATLAHVIAEQYIEYDSNIVDIGGDAMMKVTAKIRVVPHGGDSI